MKRNQFLAPLLMTLAMVLLSVIPVAGQSAFFQAVTNLHPVAYWPLQETNSPPAADVEINRGSLGAVANAYYSSTNVYQNYQNQSGAPAPQADYSDPYVYCNGNNGGFLAVPNADHRVSLTNTGAFTVELWISPANYNGYRAIIAQAGPNPGGLNNSGNKAGWVLSQNYNATLDSGNFRGFSFHVYNGKGDGGAEADVTGYILNNWYYLVGVFDGTNAYLYVNGVNAATSSPIDGSFVPDTWDPLTIGCGRGLNNNRFTGGIDEVAIYTNALTAAKVEAHYEAAIYSSGYFTTVMGDNPYMYWRMDTTNYTPPAVSAYPVAKSYGSGSGLEGLYLSGTTPGVAGPQLPGLLDANNGNASYACAFNGIGTDNTNEVGVATNGVVFDSTVLNSGVIVTNTDDALNQSANDYTLICWFKGNPMDSGRLGTLMGRQGSWQLHLDGGSGEFRFNPGIPSAFSTPVVYNDGNWHFAAAVSTIGSNTVVTVDTNTTPPTTNIVVNVAATNDLYIDGVLSASAVTAVPGVTNNSLTLGGMTGFDQSGNNGYSQRFFAGSLAQVAVFTNALSAAQVINLYTNATAGVPPPAPFITGQPYPYPSVRTFVAGPGVYLYEGVTASGGTPDLGYQWYYNTTSNYAGATALVDDGVHYVDATTFNMTLTNLTSSDSGYYFCVVNNNYGATTSAIVDVQIITKPVITAQSPTGPFTIFAGQIPSLSVTTLGETNNLSYQWFTNDVADPSGTSATYSGASATVGMTGETYYCIVSNDFGSVTSAVATVTVESLPAAIANSLYATNILALVPTAYWPLHETTPAAPGAVETNLGSLGDLADGYYSDFATSPHSSEITRDVSGALVGDNNPAVYFNAGNTGYPTAGPHFMLIPLTGIDLTPPYSIEFWFNPDNTHFCDVLDAGFRVVWTGGNLKFYNQITTGYKYPIGQWHDVVVTVDANHDASIYVDGNLDGGPTHVTAFLTHDEPIQIGDGLFKDGGPTRPAACAIDEVSIYGTNLNSTTIYNHYHDGLQDGASYDGLSYYASVTNSDPLIYLRMDAPTYTPPDQSTWPVATNYGAVAVDGVYTPGTVPGEVDGPNNGAGLISSTMSGTKALAGDGMSAYVDAGYSPALDPTGNTPLSASVWFKGNPADSYRFQTIMGGGNQSWRINMDTGGKLRFQVGGNTSLTSTKSYNDGLWHQAVGVWDGSTEYLYVDGSLDTEAVNQTNTVVASTKHVILGGAPDYLFTGGNNIGRNFGGDICEAAFWNGTALGSNQVAALYQASGMAPIITTQPISGTVNARTAFTNMVAGFGPGPLMYQWYRNGQPLPIGGQTNLTFGATNASLAIKPVKASDQSADYYAVISNIYGSATSSVVSLSVNSEPTFTSEPIDVTYTNNILLFAGATPTFSASAVGAEPISYQWFTNGVAASSNDPSLTSFTLPAVQSGGGVTSFYCQASNFVGTTLSTPISITVLSDPSAPYPHAVLMDNPIGFWRLDEPDDGTAGGDGNAGVLAHDYWGADNGIYTNTYLGGYYGSYSTPPPYSPLDTDTNPAMFGIYSSADSDAYGISNVDFASPTNTSAAFSVEAWVNGFGQSKDAGIVSKGYGSGGEQFNLDTGSGAAGSKTKSFRFFVRDANGTVYGVNSSVQPLTGSVWYHLVGVCDEPNGTVTLYINGAVAGTSAIPPGSGILSSDRAMLIGSRPSSSTSDNDDQFLGWINNVAVYNYALSASQIEAQYAAAGVPPNFTQAPPLNVAVNGLGTLTLPATAVGTPPMSYQWYDPYGATNVAVGATNGLLLDAGLTVSNVPLAWDGDTLELTVSNAYGTITTNVTLKVYKQLQFLVDLPPKAIVAAGKTYTYSVSAAGREPLSYQWYNAGSPMPDATNSTLSVVAGAAGGTTTYSVQVTDGIGATTNSITSTFISVARPSGYSFVTNILAMNPVGYWPLQETSAPGPVTLETNYGSLGALGTAYYAGTNAAAAVTGGNVTFGVTGALTPSGDNDTAARFLNGNNNSYLFVPIDSPALRLKPPLTFECWYNPASGSPFGDIMSDGGAPGDGSGNWGGFRISYSGSGGGRLEAYCYYGSGGSYRSENSVNGLTAGAWHQCVMTYDGTNLDLYVDGALKNSAIHTDLVGSDDVPLTIGTGRWDGGPTRTPSGAIDEVAVYTNALRPDRIMAHYVAGATNSSGSNYVSAVMTDNPLLYYRMDATYVSPDPMTYPIAVNYGSASVNGSYESGIMPGGVPGPTNSVLGMSALAAPINGVFSCVDAGYDPAFNPTGTQPFTAMTWFKGNPADNRVQCIMGQGQNWAMNFDGSTGRIVWNLYGGGQVTSTTVLNDGNWHLIAGVYDGVNSYLYVDGALNNSGPATVGLSGEPNTDLFLGGNADYTFDQYQWGARYFAGALAQAAFFTNALSASQIQVLYNGSVTPMIGMGYSGNNLIITYTGSLLSSTNVAGPFTPVAGAPFAASPTDYTVSPTEGQVFYRTSSQ